MINLNVIKDDEKIIAEYHLKANDRIDNLTLGMLVNNDIEGVASLVTSQIDDDRYFKYDVTDMITLREYLGEYVKKDNLLKSFYSIALAIRESTKYMINWTSFSLDIDEIYIYKETGKVRLICLPLLTVVNDGNLCNFFKNVLFSSQFDTSESSDYVGKLINFLNLRIYTLDRFIYELEELLGIEHVIEEDENIEEYETIETEEKAETKEETVTEEKAEVKEETVIEEKVEAKAEEVETVEEEFVAEDNVVSDKTTEYVTSNDKEKPTEIVVEEKKPFLVRCSNREKVIINKDVFYVGKNESEVDYCIEGNPTVEDKHAYFIKHGKEYFVVDNNTKSRTYLNRVEIQEDEEVFIPHGAHISFGSEEFEFKMHE